jgi:hypothetical protein
VGATLSTIEKSFKEMVRVRSSWRITVDGRQADHGLYHAMIIVNGYLGTDLPFAKGVMLGSGDFHMFALRDLGIGRLPGQFKHAWDASIMDAPDRWGLEPHRIQSELVIAPDDQRPFPVNVDGSTMLCRGAARFRIVDQLRLISRLPPTSRSMG